MLYKLRYTVKNNGPKLNIKIIYEILHSVSVKVYFYTDTFVLIAIVLCYYALFFTQNSIPRVFFYSIS